MLDIIDKGTKEPLFAQTNRPSDVLGNAVAERGRVIAKQNYIASKQIGDIAKTIKEPVDISIPASQFISKLKELGVAFSKGEDGWITPDFSRSEFMGGSQKDMSVLINKALKRQLPFEEAHKLKRMIRDNIDYDAAGPGAIKGESQHILKQLSSGIDELLDTTSEPYRKANERYAKTIGIKERFDKLTGKEIDLFADAADKSLANKARRLVSNMQSRAEIEQLIRETENTLNSMGVRFKDDISSLNYAVTQLENAFKIEPPRSFQGGIMRGTINAQTALNPKGAAVETIIDKAFSLNKPDYNKKMRAFRSLVEKNNRN